MFKCVVLPAIQHKSSFSEIFAAKSLSKNRRDDLPGQFRIREFTLPFHRGVPVDNGTDFERDKQSNNWSWLSAPQVANN